MQKPSSSKTYLIVIAVIIVIGIAYYFYSSGNKTAKEAVSTGGVNSLSTVGVDGTTNAAAGAEVGADVLTLLNKINSLRIDASIFASPSYQSLVDFSVEIPTENVGRPNPFAPLPGSVGAQSKDASAAARVLPRR